MIDVLKRSTIHNKILKKEMLQTHISLNRAYWSKQTPNDQVLIFK